MEIDRWQDGQERFKALPLVHRLSILSLWSATAIVGRVLCSGLPNVQPVTVMIILATPLFGLGNGILVALLIMLHSNILLGFGLWTVAQILSYALIVLITGFLERFFTQRWPWLEVLWAGLAGYLYGFIISLLMLFVFGLKTPFWPYYLNGLPFDTLHALGNIGFMLVLRPVVRRLLKERLLF